MSGAMAKDLKDLIPALDDQGIPNVAGASQRGVSIQHLTFTMGSAPDTVVFLEQGLKDMANATYVVLSQNQSDVADPAVIDQKATASFRINGPDTSDVVDVIIVGQLKSQLK